MFIKHVSIAGMLLLASVGCQQAQNTQQKTPNEKEPILILEKRSGKQHGYLAYYSNENILLNDSDRVSAPGVDIELVMNDVDCRKVSYEKVRTARNKHKVLYEAKVTVGSLPRQFIECEIDERNGACCPEFE